MNNKFHHSSFMVLSICFSILVLVCSQLRNKVDLLSATDVEALASDESLSEWWERKDWVCREVQCTPIIQSYFPEKVEAGAGTNAHSWECTTCSDIMGDGNHYYSMP